MLCNDDDWQLCRLAGQGSAEAYTELYHRYALVVRSQLHRHCRSDAFAELQDLEQQVWCAVWTGLARFDGRSGVATWLVAITKHVACISARAQRRAGLSLARFAQLNQPGPDEELDGIFWDRMTLGDALAGLAPAIRLVIELRYFGGLTDKEIARRLHTPLGTVKGRLRAGLVQLRRGFGLGPRRRSQPEPSGTGPGTKLKRSAPP